MTEAVLHLVTTFDRGGAETALLHLVREQRARGRTVDVAWLKGRGELAEAAAATGAGVHDLGARGAVRVWSGARRLLRARSPGILHTHLFKADALGAAIVGAGPSAPRLVSTKHNEDVYLRRRHWRALGRRVASRAHALVAISPGVARFVRDALGGAAPRIETIPYGLPEPERAGDAAAFRATHDISVDAPLVLCPARFEAQKDHATLLAAMGRVRNDQAVLVLAGRGTLEPDVRARAANLPAGRVRFVGFQPDLTDAYAAADLVVLASQHEGLGLVLLEAALHGVPAVATSVGGIPDVVVSGHTGSLVPPGDTAALGTAIDALLADAPLRAAFGAAARQRAREEHGVARYADAHDALYASSAGAGA